MPCYGSLMRAIQGKCEISTNDQGIIGRSDYCLITDSEGHMTARPELAGKLWLIEKMEKKELYIKIQTREKYFTGQITLTSSPAHPDKELSTRIKFSILGELKEALL
jgi:hypothetical protein